MYIGLRPFLFEYNYSELDLSGIETDFYSAADMLPSHAFISLSLSSWPLLTVAILSIPLGFTSW